MRGATNLSIVLTFFVATSLFVTSHYAARLYTNGPTTSALHEMARVTTRGLSRLGCIRSCIKVSLDPSECPPITEAEMNSCDQWYAAVCSKDPMTLQKMLKLCKYHEERYASQMRLACGTALFNQQWKNLTKIIEAMCMDLDQFEWYISDWISRATRWTNVPYIAAILDGIAGEMGQMLKAVGNVLAIIAVIGPKDYPEIVEKICKHVADARLKEIGVVARITGKEERLDALEACLTCRNDWPHDLINEMARVALETREYRTLELLLDVNPSNKDDLRSQAIYGLWAEISTGNPHVNELIRIFDISPSEVHNSLNKTVRNCIYQGSMRSLETICQFLDNKPQQHKLTVDAALKGLTQEDLARLDTEALRRLRMFQDWSIKEKHHQKAHSAHLNVHCSNAKQLYDMIDQCTT